jgi:hypothetical protein
VDNQNKFRCDNACIAEDYKELANNQAVGVNYGIIKSMFIARLGNEPEEIFVECDWYEKVGVNARTKLTQVRRNTHFDACRVNFLKNLYPKNFVMWPSDFSNEHSDLFDVIMHHE